MKRRRIWVVGMVAEFEKEDVEGEQQSTKKDDRNEAVLKAFRASYGAVVDLYVFLSGHFYPAVDGPIHILLVLFVLFVCNYFLGVLSTWLMFLTLIMITEMAMTKRGQSQSFPNCVAAIARGVQVYGTRRVAERQH